MSITQLCNATPTDRLEQDDPDVKLAAEALGSMAKANQTITLPPLSTYSAPSTTPSSPLPTPTSSNRYSFSSDSTQDDEKQQQQPFMHRVSNIPLVNSALRAYESSKQSNSVVKYGAEMVESFAAPIYDKFGKRALSGAADDWGCKQLDKSEDHYFNQAPPQDQEEDDAALAAASALARASLRDNHERDFRRRRMEDSRDEPYNMKSRSSRPCSRSTSPHRPYSVIAKSSSARLRSQPNTRSRWQQIVMHAGSAAGSTAAVVSEESMKCLRYCLSWLQYATQHIDQQMNILRNFLVSLATGSSNEKAVANPTSAASTLASIKKEIVDTLRKVVEVVSKYAGSGLPEQAKASVRGFILALPGRWAVLNTATGSPSGSGSPTVPEVHETSIKLLNFGGESIEMLTSVSTVFSDTIERAELWLEKLRGVGVKKEPSLKTVDEHKPEQMDLN
ncbi:hypothetical protein DFQ28_008909 [Apophysomyces sp. BC1034]|nr:hypothetical protein DFQ30_006216 [Apophysomyces sp. BC1015]KAG0181773.1 hypothetical protein DFQ29_007101 [Apophysomyces sp. BC1021]KAG0192517.1 hypothetical protein DFQ28_008909 [Apophysomyces sp. BC1034]